MRLVLRVRRFVCQNQSCSRRTFAEVFPDLVAVYARRTRRQANVLQELAFAVGGRAGSPLARRFGVPASRQTLLRLLRQCGVPAFPPPRVLGIDEWAWRKGRRYGTILVDLERHTPIDLLPDCASERVSAWLKSHPSIEVVSRDRDSAFADAIRKGAPQAVQVADRWHLIQNLYEALKDSLGQKHPSRLLLLFFVSVYPHGRSLGSSWPLWRSLSQNNDLNWNSFVKRRAAFRKPMN